MMGTDWYEALEQSAKDTREKDARIADLEKQLAEERQISGNREIMAVESARELRQQLAEQTKRADAAERLAIEAENVRDAGWPSTLRKRAEVAEKRVAELQALVDAATSFFFGAFTAREDLYKAGWVIDSNCGRRAPKGRMLKVKAIALARELAAKDPLCPGR